MMTEAGHDTHFVIGTAGPKSSRIAAPEGRHPMSRGPTRDSTVDD
jgi:hypothetical protein